MWGSSFLELKLPELRGCMFGSTYSRSPKVGNPIASIVKRNVYGIPALIVLNPVSNFLEFRV